MGDQRIAMFELAVVGGEVKVVDEKHYQLTPAAGISKDDLLRYAAHSGV